MDKKKYGYYIVYGEQPEREEFFRFCLLPKWGFGCRVVRSEVVTNKNLARVGPGEVAPTELAKQRDQDAGKVIVARCAWSCKDG